MPYAPYHTGCALHKSAFAGGAATDPTGHLPGWINFLRVCMGQREGEAVGDATETEEVSETAISLFP